MNSRPYAFFRVSTPQEWVAHVELNRPDKLNAFQEEMRLEMRDIFDTLSNDASVRAIVLSGAGDKAFSAGLDIQWATATGSILNPKNVDQIDVARRATELRRWLLDFQDCVSSIERCEKCVICVIHGYAFGLGIDIASCTDIRICAENSKFSVKEVDIGLAADVGTLSRLPKIVGSYGWVKEVCLTARTFGAREALHMGFVNNVLPTKEDALQEAIRIAALISQKSPVATSGTKNFLDWSRDHSVSDGLRYSAIWNSGAIQTKDISISLEANTTGKKPRFEKL